MNNKSFNFSKIIVHGGCFHADDVFCVAMAQIINPDIEVIRINDLKMIDNIDNCIICDIGEGRYDHHQYEAELRADGNKYAACGLFYRDFKNDLFETTSIKEYFLDSFIIAIEDADNGISGNPLTSAISSFSCYKDMDEGFAKAVAFTKEVLSNLKIKDKQMAIDETKVAESIANNEGKKVVVNKEYLPTSLYVGTGIIFQVSPSLRGGYQLLTIKRTKDSMEDVISLPESWLTNKPDGCTFVHRGLFIASFETEEQAVKAANSILEQA